MPEIDNFNITWDNPSHIDMDSFILDAWDSITYNPCGEIPMTVKCPCCKESHTETNGYVGGICKNCLRDKKIDSICQ